MTAREKFLRTIGFDTAGGCLPMIEWAAWWDKTVERWWSEGLDTRLDYEDMQRFFGLDVMTLLHGGSHGAGFPHPRIHGAPVIRNLQDYQDILPTLYQPARIEGVLHHARRIKAAHDRGDIIVRLWLDGFFWHPRELFGIENHFYAFYDAPELMREINRRLATYNIEMVERLCEILTPDMIGYAEDMSYNHGPMLSRDMFDEFLLPYYRRVNPYIRERGVKILADSDGDVSTMIPWLIDAGIDGVYPLERQAGVDIVQLREKYPRFIMMGGYDKRVLHKGEDAIRREFERILPVMASGGYIPSVDHQTPPEVSLDDYYIYLRLFREYVKQG